ncbi:MAG: alpha/beta hydrolase [Geobacteraceae bacterium]|nr:alpha/beta hydrolase [Geobacteraceae bacterium]
MKAHINGISLSYGDTGSGPAVVLLHGFPLSRGMWPPQEEALAKAGYRLITPDLRGFGESEVPEGPYSMSMFSDDVVALLDFLEIDRAVIGGMSMGGYILLDLLERYPERVVAACFITTRSTSDSEAAKAGRLALLERTKKNGTQSMAELSTATLLAGETLERNPELVNTVYRWMTSVDIRGIEGALYALLDRKDYSSHLVNFDLPALVIGADQDSAIKQEDLLVLSKGLPNCELCIIPQAGHMANLEQPEAFNNCLLRFLHRVCTEKGI